jgi:hypothetical protein
MSLRSLKLSTYVVVTPREKEKKNSSPRNCHLFTALMQNLDYRRFKDDREVQTAVTQ